MLVAALAASCGDEDGQADQPAEPPTVAEQGPTPEQEEAAAEAERSLLEEEQSDRERVRSSARGVRLVAVGRFDQPVYVTAPPGDRSRLFVVEQPGRIVVRRTGRNRTFLDIRSDVRAGGEQGLLSMAFAPDYASSGRFYVYFTGRDGDIRIQEFRGRGDRADRGSRRQLLRIEHSQFGNHNGGQLQFGPDGLLYIGTGDGGGGGDPFGSGQNVERLLGKLLRIDPSRRPYGIPSGNPFAGDRRGRGEVYAYGLRNPWRFSFDRATGDLVIADVGQNAVEEVDFVAEGDGLGANFGWNRFEGSRRFSRGSAPGHVPPVIEHSHGAGFCSITGGYVVRDPGLPQLRGHYVYGDFCDGRLRAARLTRSGASRRRLLGPRVSSLSSFGEDSRGRVYAASLDGPVYRIASR